MEVLDKLNYIGLDLNNIPEFMRKPADLEFKLIRNYSEKNYKVYKYINVNEIQIFLTPTNRLSEIMDKYSKAVPLATYLSLNAENGEKQYSGFLELLEKTEISDIEELEEKQKQCNNEIPYLVKFHKDYLWQIYYSDLTNKYFMLVPTQETEYEAMFYVLKKQLKNENEKIYVPICYTHYSFEYLSQTDIEEIENEMWFFTKNWPQTYEVINKEGELSIQIVGTFELDNTLETSYKIILKNREQALEFYKLLKALFMLQSKLPHCYDFKIKINEQGEIDFYKENEKITFPSLAEFIKKEHIYVITKMVDINEERINLENKLIKLNTKSSKIDKEYFEKEKQISTFLECKKTFFGKVKYFFRYKKVKTDEKEEKNNENEKEQTLHFFQKPEIKEYYTLEETIETYKKLDKEIEIVKTLKKDIEAIQGRIDTMSKKLKNAKLYIKEIDEHKRSIFEFWKFTNKDDTKQLNKGTPQEEEQKLKQTFEFDTDFEELAEKLDKFQRNVLTKEEFESAYLASAEILELFNKAIKSEEISSESLEILKQEMQEKNFDLFGGITTATGETRVLGSKRHRETEREKLSILRISKNMTLEEFRENLTAMAKNLETAISKCKIGIEIPIYRFEPITGKFNKFYLNPQKHIKHSNEITLYKTVLHEDTKAVASTNIIFYNNINQTLPLGMNVEDTVILDVENINFQEINTEETYITIVDKNEKAKIFKVKTIEYMY